MYICMFACVYVQVSAPVHMWWHQKPSLPFTALLEAVSLIEPRTLWHGWASLASTLFQESTIPGCQGWIDIPHSAFTWLLDVQILVLKHAQQVLYPQGSFRILGLGFSAPLETGICFFRIVVKKPLCLTDSIINCVPLWLTFSVHWISKGRNFFT